MNTENKSHESTETFVQSLVDIGTEWAVFGISFGKEALEKTARSLELAAKTLSTVSTQLEKKLAHAPEGDTVVVEPDPPAAS
jgi:hypothetical protein